MISSSLISNDFPTSANLIAAGPHCREERHVVMVLYRSVPASFGATQSSEIFLPLRVRYIPSTCASSSTPNSGHFEQMFESLVGGD
jgi:hypothetical protein